MGPSTGGRVVFASALVAVAIAAAFVVGFGAKTTCTNDAFPAGCPESACDVIDRWAWFAVGATSMMGVAHVASGGRMNHAVAVVATAVALVTMTVAMTTAP